MRKTPTSEGKLDPVRAVAAMGIRAQDKARALAYYGRSARTYHKTRVKRWPFCWFLEQERRAVLDMTSFVEGERFLDVGCGAGFYARKAKDKGMIVTAVDARAEMVAEVEPFVNEAYMADVETLRVRTLFLGVVCAGVLDFVLDPTQALANLAMCMAPGGWLVVLVPRVGFGGRLYQIEKRLSGFGVNLFSREWFQREATLLRLRVTRYNEPRAHNLVIRLEHEPSK